MEYFIKKFRDLAAFGDYLDAAQPNEHWAARGIYAQSSQDVGERVEWFGSNSYAEADEWMKMGDKENAKSLIAASAGVKIPFKHGTRAKDISAISGYRPNVPAYIKGLPNAMYKRVKQPMKAKIVTIIYNNSADASVSTAEKVLAGCKMAYCILALEKQGYRVNLFCSTIATNGNQACGPVVRIKSAEQPINVMKMAYPVINSGFQRRHGFRFRETTQGLTSSWVNGYGSSVTSRSELESILKGAGIKYDVALTYYDIEYCRIANDVLERYFRQWKQ